MVTSNTLKIDDSFHFVNLNTIQNPYPSPVAEFSKASKILNLTKASLAFTWFLVADSVVSTIDVTVVLWLCRAYKKVLMELTSFVAFNDKVVALEDHL